MVQILHREIQSIEGVYIYIFLIVFGVNIKTNDGERELHELFATG